MSSSAPRCTSPTTPWGSPPGEVVGALDDGDVALLENVRFNPGETSKDDAERGEFADQLAELGDAFVSDGFGVVHRKQASVYDVAKRLPHAMGGLVRAEIEVLRKLTADPEHPYVVVLGGSKVSDKLAVIDNLLGTADKLLIGGGMVFTFLAAQGHEVGQSLLEEDQVETCKEYLRRSTESGVEILLPTDIVVAPEFKADAPPTTVAADAMPKDQVGLDIGPESGEGVRRGDPGGPHGLLERSDGRLRVRGLLRRHPCRRAGADRGRRALGGRRWRLRGRRTPARLRRELLRAHLHRWWGQPGVPRGQGPARHRRTRDDCAANPTEEPCPSRPARR